MRHVKKIRWNFLPGQIICLLLAVSGVLKITHLHPMMEHFKEMGLYPYLSLLGVVETISALLFLFAPASRIGLLLLTAYLGGAMAAELPYGAILPPATTLALVWLSAWLRQPSLFRFQKNVQLS